MCLKEIKYRFNHRSENVFKQFLKVYFGCVSLELPKSKLDELSNHVGQVQASVTI